MLAANRCSFAVYATKKHIRYRYYVSRSLQLGEGHQSSGLRLPAREIEGVVKEQVALLFDDPLMLASRLSLDISPSLLRQMTGHCQSIAAELRSRTGGLLSDIISQVRALDGKLEVDINVNTIAALIGSDAENESAPPFTISIAFRLTRTGRAIRLVQSNGALGRNDLADPALLKQVIQARTWWNILSDGEMTIAALARQEGVTPSYISRVIGVAFLAPAVIDAIIEGRQHGELDAAMLRQTAAVPARWDEQMAKFLPG